MNINITGDGLELTPALQDHVKERLSKIERVRDQITKVEVVLSVEGKRQKAEIRMVIPHTSDINAESVTEDLYVSIDDAVHKLEKQFIRGKDKALKLQRQRQDPYQDIEEELTE